jgi:hypothetical protein
MISRGRSFEKFSGRSWRLRWKRRWAPKKGAHAESMWLPIAILPPDAGNPAGEPELGAPQDRQGTLGRRSSSRFGAAKGRPGANADFSPDETPCRASLTVLSVTIRTAFATI